MPRSPSTEPFERRMAEMGLTLATLTPLTAFELFIDSDVYDPPPGLLSWWWGDVGKFGSCWGLSMTATWTRHDDPDDVRVDGSLEILMRYGPDHESEEPRGDRKVWYVLPDEVADLRGVFTASPTFARLGDTPAEAVAFDIHGPGRDWHALYDVWGHRDPSRPIIQMTEEEWLRCEDVPTMLRWLFDHWPGPEEELDRRLGRYFLACCQRIWRLLPQEESRNGVEIAERYLDGLVTFEEFRLAEYKAEGAAFHIDQAFESPRDMLLRAGLDHLVDDFEEDSRRSRIAVTSWIEETAQIPADEIAEMLWRPRLDDNLTPLGLLTHAASFVDSAMCYSSTSPKVSIGSYRLFLPAPLLREFVGNPFRRDDDGRSGSITTDAAGR